MPNRVQWNDNRDRPLALALAGSGVSLFTLGTAIIALITTLIIRFTKPELADYLIMQNTFNLLVIGGASAASVVLNLEAERFRSPLLLTIGRNSFLFGLGFTVVVILGSLLLVIRL